MGNIYGFYVNGVAGAWNGQWSFNGYTGARTTVQDATIDGYVSITWSNNNATLKALKDGYYMYNKPGTHILTFGNLNANDTTTGITPTTTGDLFFECMIWIDNKR